MSDKLPKSDQYASTSSIVPPVPTTGPMSSISTILSAQQKSDSHIRGTSNSAQDTKDEPMM